MNTKIIKINSKDINLKELSKGAEILKKGGTVCFPTETVYGLGANALDSVAANKIFEAKGRPADNPLIVHITDIKDLNELVSEISDEAQTLMDNFWPGPLTLIFKKSDKVPTEITAGLDTVAVRMPHNIIARELIKLSGLPIAAPSANTSGKPSPTKAKHVIEDLDGRVDMIIDGEDAEIGLESTVLDVSTETPMILRPGAITKEMCQKLIGEVRIDPAIKSKLDKNQVPKSPGMKYKHYAPKADVTVVAGELNKVVSKIKQLSEINTDMGLKVGIMATDETKNSYDSDFVVSLGSRKKLEIIAANLFDTLRYFDELGVDIVLAENITIEGIGMAIMNRLNKAAGFNILTV